MARMKTKRALRLRPGQEIKSAQTGLSYRVAKPLGAGGFGATYLALRTGSKTAADRRVCLKITDQVDAWHGEAYFGRLFGNHDRILSVHDSFACTHGRRNAILYCLVTDFAEGGDLHTYLRRHPAPWSEARIRSEMISLIDAVELLHKSGALHRDLTPGNILVTDGPKLKLADFGIAIHRIANKHVLATAFAPAFAPTEILENKRLFWKPSHDIYQLGQILAMLLCGNADEKLSSRQVRDIDCDPRLKEIVQRCIGPATKRFADASQLRAALDRRKSRLALARVASLRGKTVVITGRLSRARDYIHRQVKTIGARVGHKVNGSTDVLVVGDRNAQYKADLKGQKLLDLEHERERGHRIAVISESALLRILRAEAKRHVVAKPRSKKR